MIGGKLIFLGLGIGALYCFYHLYDTVQIEKDYKNQNIILPLKYKYGKQKSQFFYSKKIEITRQTEINYIGFIKKIFQ